MASFSTHHYIRITTRFVLKPEQLEIYDPQGNRFLTTLELSQKVAEEQQRASLAESEVARLRALLLEAGIASEKLS